MSEVNKRTHRFDAEATVLSGHLDLPVSQTIAPQAYSKLPEKGGYINQRSDSFRIETIMSFSAA